MNDLKKQADEILKLAEGSGVQSNFLFVTTFDRYITQINMLGKLKKVVTSENALVTKEYVKGRANLMTHPAIREYNRTADAANKTAQQLMRIIKQFGVKEKKKEDDLLVRILNGEFVKSE